MQSYSILMAVYKNDHSFFLDEALNSIAQQTIQPFEIIIIKDGPVKFEIEQIICKWSLTLPIKQTGYDQNRGLAFALNYGLTLVQTEIVGRMDSDDICYPDRFEKQLRFFEENPSASIVGTGINEFYYSYNKSIIKTRTYPKLVTKDSKCLFKGTPIAHPTLLIKTKLLKENPYSISTSSNEDIDLWFRLLNAGYSINNLSEPLLNFRITDSTFSRRGWKKSLNEFKIYWTNLYHSQGFKLNLLYVLLRFISRLLPPILNKTLYLSNVRQKFFSLKHYNEY